MQVNAQFDTPVALHTDALEWRASPMAGVDRRMLDRIGGEVARATSIVRYASGSAFSEHTHAGGEEFIVLEGVFQDEHGDYPAGTYVRNPVGSHHIPRSDDGCTIFVKLWQFDRHDQEQVVIDLNSVRLSVHRDNPDIRYHSLALRDYERVTIEEWDGGKSFHLREHGGFEMLVLDGELEHQGETYSKHDWIRWPDDRSARFETGEVGARLWIKRGHLAKISVPSE